jgi:hypothetical protein
MVRIMSGTNDQDARALTYLARRLRTETHGCREWDDAGTYAKISELTGQNLALTIERVLCHATDPEAKTPGAILRNFTPPRPSTREPEKRGNPHKADECRKHMGEWADACRCCKVDAYDSDDDPPRTNHADAAFDASLARARGADLVRRAAGWTTEIDPETANAEEAAK